MGKQIVDAVETRELRGFMAREYPGLSASQISSKLSLFLRSLINWTERRGLSLVFVCPHGDRRGNCRCPQLGWYSPSRHRWQYRLYRECALQWRPTRASLLGLRAEEIDSIHPLTAQRLRRLVQYLKTNQ